jgi:hypothetical protein
MASFIRVHTAPKICKNKDKFLWGAKEHWKYDNSYDRYQKTDDGKYIASTAAIVLQQQEIGRYESVRFIETLH